MSGNPSFVIAAFVHAIAGLIGFIAPTNEKFIIVGAEDDRFPPTVQIILFVKARCKNQRPRLELPPFSVVGESAFLVCFGFEQAFQLRHDFGQSRRQRETSLRVNDALGRSGRGLSMFRPAGLRVSSRDFILPGVEPGARTPRGGGGDCGRGEIAGQFLAQGHIGCWRPADCAIGNPCRHGFGLRTSQRRERRRGLPLCIPGLAKPGTRQPLVRDRGKRGGILKSVAKT
ncbi:MAG: hypothetical protein ACREDM_13245 [Methylocella sp.]